MNKLDMSKWVDRVRITLACRDADILPRTQNAGEYAVQDGIDIQFMHNGVKVVRDCYYSPYMTQIIHMMKGVHEPQEEKCFAEILKFIPPGATMLELGCYWGYYSLWFWKEIEDAHCHLVEIDERLMGVAIKNFEINNARGIFTNAGIGTPNLDPWSTKVEGRYVRAQPSGVIFAPDRHSIPGFHRNIPLITVDQYLRDNNIRYLDILHSDIQGEELAMLDGAEEAFRTRRVSFTIISTHINDAFHGKCLDKIANFGYEVIAEHNVSDSYSGDGLIAAKNPEIKFPKKIEISLRGNSIF